MRTPHLVAGLATAVAFAAAPLHAQHTMPDANRASRVVATYDFGMKRRAITFPRTVVVEDSAGTLTAHASLNRGRDEIPLQVTVLESDLVLQGETPDGVMTIVLERQNDGERGAAAAGRWTVGEKSGKLRVRTRS